MPRDDLRTADREPVADRRAAGRSPLSLLATIGRPGDLLPHLHLYAVDRVGGRGAILFRYNPRNGGLQATSAFNLDVLKTDPWEPIGDEAIIVRSAFADREPVLIADADRRMPDLA